MREDLTWSMRALVAANVWAALVLLAAIGVGAHDGFGSGVVFIGSTPIVLCGVCSALYAVGKKRDLRAPVILAIALCALGALTALVSFIGPLVVAVMPATALLIAACVPLLLRAYGITAT